MSLVATFCYFLFAFSSETESNGELENRNEETDSDFNDLEAIVSDNEVRTHFL